MEKKLDLRVYKTRKALTEALYDLLCEKSFDKITITELCERAMVRKATFYKHFADKTELLAYMIRELQQMALEQNAIGYNKDIPQSYYIGVFSFLLDFLESNQRFVLSVLKNSASAVVLDILLDQIQLDIRQHMKSESYAPVADASPMLTAIYAGAIVSCGKWWITQKKRPDKESVVTTFARFMMKF